VRRPLERKVDEQRIPIHDAANLLNPEATTGRLRQARLANLLLVLIS
jgi:hypothetical protein